MRLLPANLARLADHADDRATGRFAIGAVRLRLTPDNTFSAEATDTKVLVRVSGPCTGNPEEYPDCVPGLADAPNGNKGEALIPAAAWRKSFAAARKLTGKTRFPHEALRCVAVKVGGDVATLAATDTANHLCESTPVLAGRFPPADDILNNRIAGAARVRFAVDPILLAGVLKTAAEVACDEADRRVVIEVRDPDRPVHVRAGRDGGVQLHAVVMPLGDGKEESGASGGPGAADDTRPAEVEELRAKLAAVTAERDRLAARVRSLEAGQPVPSAAADATRGPTRAERLAALKGVQS